MNVTEVGARIKSRRKELKISAEELGKRIGKDRSTIYRYEKGEIDKLPFEVLKPLAEALDTTEDHLVGWDNVERENEEAKKILTKLADDKNYARIVIRAMKDKEFYELCNTLNKLNKKQISSVKTMLRNLLE